MALLRNLECRHITLGDTRTCIALEPIFWKVAEQQAQAEGISWHEWTAHNLIKPDISGGRASRLRVAILEAVCN